MTDWAPYAKHHNTYLGYDTPICHLTSRGRAAVAAKTLILRVRYTEGCCGWEMEFAYVVPDAAPWGAQETSVPA